MNNPSASHSPLRPAKISRRSVLAGAATAAAALVAAPAVAVTDDWKIRQGRIRQSVVHWCFDPMSVETLAQAASQMGLQSVELIDPSHWPTLKKYGLTCAIAPSHGFERGLNHTENHAECLEKLTSAIEAAAAFGCPSVITFSGMRRGISDEQGIANTVAGLKKILPLAERKNVTLCIEVLNSRVDTKMKGHPDYQCDRVEWAADVCRQVGSPRMKMLFDIYHVQIMQGDIITRIREFKEYIGHYHTAGVPGRNELDQTQEINYPPIMQAIIDSGYEGFVGQEFIPRSSDPIASLRQAAQLCDV